MSKTIASLKLELNSSKLLKKPDLQVTSNKSQTNKSVEKPLNSKLVPKLQLTSRDSSSSSKQSLKLSQVSLNTSRVLKESNLPSRPSLTKKTPQPENDLKSGFPMNPSSALRIFKSHLTAWENAEILEYSQVYYIGQKSKNKSQSANNNGFDDDRNDYRAATGDHIAYRYEILQMLGKGSFGQVFKVMDHKTKELQALKIIRNKPRFHQQGEVEVKILKELKDSDKDDKSNIIHIKEDFTFRQHLCITFEILSINLYEFLKSNSFNGLSLSLIQRFTFQLLQGLKLTSSSRIIHCDLKPENILLKQSSKSCIKIIDFGSSCFEDQRIFSYIQSRFYRAPEVILGIPYTSAIDMWSLGCILVELYTGVPLFPGENELDQILSIMEVLGLPPDDFIKSGTRSKLFFDLDGKPKIVPNSRGKRRTPASRHLRELLVGTDKDYQDFIAKCLEWNPVRRLTPEIGLVHPWIRALEQMQNTSRGRRLSYANVIGASSTRHAKTNSFIFM